MSLPSVIGLALTASTLTPSAMGAEATWLSTLPMNPRTQQHLDLFPNGVAYAYVAQDNIVYASNDFGMTWLPRTTAPAPYSAVGFGTPKVGYAASFSGELMRTEDSAQTWVSHSAPVGQEVAYHALNIAARGRVVVIGGHRWVSGCPPPEKGSVSIWYSGDAGATWREKRLPFMGAVHRIDMLDARTGVAIVYDGYRLVDEERCQHESSSNGVWLTRDGFKTMRKIYDCSGDEICTAATMASQSRILIGTNNADLYLSTSGGHGFARMGGFSGSYDAVGEPYFWIGGLGFASAKVGYMSTKGGGTWRTTDGGRTWIEERSTERAWGVGVGDIAVADADHAIAGGPNFVITRLPPDD